MRGKLNARTAAIIFGAALVIMLAVAAITRGITADGPSGDAVASVDGEDISREDFDVVFAQAIEQQQLPAPPEEGTPEYEELRNQALGRLLQETWLENEAEERGVEVTPSEIDQEIQSVRQQQQLTDPKAFQKALTEAGLTEEELGDQFRLELVSTKIQEDLAEEAPPPSEDDIEQYYESNETTFEQPASRDIRYILNADEAKAQQAKTALDADNSPESWKQVAAEFSTDTTTKNEGGVRVGVTEESFEPALDEAIFGAEEGVVSDPISTTQGFYVFQVDTITEGGVQPLSDVRGQIEQLLAPQFEQSYVQNFIMDYQDRWIEKTICAEDFAFEFCNNFTPASQPCPDPELAQEQQDQQLEEQGCPAPVAGRTVGEILGTPPLTTPPAVLPKSEQGQPAQPKEQRPHPPGEDVEQPEIPGGFPGGIPGGVPPGAVPQG